MVHDPQADRYSPVGKGIHALRCRDLTGPKPFRLLAPISPGCPEAVSPRALGCFRVSQKLGQFGPPLLTPGELGAVSSHFK
jgi:hypothetical protein